MSNCSQPLYIGMINLCIEISSNIYSHTDNSHTDSWIILWHNQQKIFLYLHNKQNTIGSLPGTLSNMLRPFFGEPQTFMRCSSGGEWIEKFQSNPTQTLFAEKVFMTDQYDPSLSQKPNILLMFFTWYPNILFIIESIIKQYFKLKPPEEYSCNSHSQCQHFTPTPPTPNSTPP
ncbi:hypothetical protein O181_005329 [Austropuccinia psidii MF-1]|uniref:Uncharacterized protein n=1 Tax=Austropuccinia psidii MF-1 TaxID=1389203 RepID=A0A9Q3BH94_9BASI|nr:hypothetical protein [Austropuccinia psidii MF-1]